MIQQNNSNNNQNKKPLTLLVLAAGMGSRYGGIKQIDGFGPCGETIMDYSLYDPVRFGFTKVVFIVREDILETVREKFEPKLRGKIQVEFVVQSLDKLVPAQSKNPQRVKPLGTAHAVLCARDKINEPFVVINADDFYGKDSFESISEFFANEKNDSHAMVGYTLSKVLSTNGSVSRGIGEVDENNFLKSVIERKKVVIENNKIIAKEVDGDIILSPDVPASMNFFGFLPSIFDFIAEKFEKFLKENYENITAEFYLSSMINEMIKENRGKMKIIGGGNVWFGVTYKDDKEAVSKSILKLIEKCDYPNNLWK